MQAWRDYAYHDHMHVKALFICMQHHVMHLMHGDDLYRPLMGHHRTVPLMYCQPTVKMAHDNVP